MRQQSQTDEGLRENEELVGKRAIGRSCGVLGIGCLQVANFHEAAGVLLWCWDSALCCCPSSMLSVDLKKIDVPGLFSQ